MDNVMFYLSTRLYYLECRDAKEDVFFVSKELRERREGNKPQNLNVAVDSKKNLKD